MASAIGHRMLPRHVRAPTVTTARIGYVTEPALCIFGIDRDMGFFERTMA